MDIAPLVARGNAALRAGDPQAAAGHYRAALAAAPLHAGLLHNLGTALRAGGDPAGAEAVLRQAIAGHPGHAAAHVALGHLLRADRRPAEALEAYRRALFLRPQDGEVRAHMGRALLELRRPHEAAVWLAQAVAAAPADAQGRVNLGGALMLAADPAAALAAYRHGRALDPELPGAALGEAFALLTLGDWAAGWQAYEARLRDPRFCPAAAAMRAPRWHGGEALHGRTLLLLSEQGLGDAIQFSRYAPLLRARGALVVLQVAPPLAPLLRPLADAVVAPGAALPPHDAWCPLLSLPRGFATTPQTVPAAPYLAADPAALHRWRRLLGRRRGLRVGLAWAGNPLHPFDHLRSLPLAALAPLLAVPGVEFHAVQPEARPDDARIRAHPEIADFADAAALLALMDVVVSVDTAAAHLAGALGRPVWIMLARPADFRWMQDRSDTPWYPSARLFRQRTAGDWSGVTGHVAEELRALAGARPMR